MLLDFKQQLLMIQILHMLVMGYGASFKFHYQRLVTPASSATGSNFIGHNAGQFWPGCFTIKFYRLPSWRLLQQMQEVVQPLYWFLSW
jgi:hypothetical protein